MSQWSAPARRSARLPCSAPPHSGGGSGHDSRTRAAAREAVIAIARNPAAEQARAVLAEEIAVLLAHDPKLAAETAVLLRKVRNRGVRIDVERIKISGNQNVVQLGEHNLSIGQAQNVEILGRANPDEDRRW